LSWSNVTTKFSRFYFYCNVSFIFMFYCHIFTAMHVVIPQKCALPLSCDHNLSLKVTFVSIQNLSTLPTSVATLSTLPSSTTSRTKWYWTPMCFVLEWKVGFLAMCKALWLSQYTIICSFLCLSSSINLCIQIASLHAWVAVMYSSSVVDRATIVCNLDNQLTAPPASVNT